ncbi:MAG: cytochrome c family protein [Planctomycetes bacterium]|nr:cytochrome c family protein [Planctomycetota bacterium]
MNMRPPAAILLLGLVVGAVFVLSDETSRVQPVPTRTTSAQTGTAAPTVPGSPTAATASADPFQTAAECQPCHQDVWAEWKPSFHGQAWTDPMVYALSKGFRMPECIDCHAPLPIHVTGVATRVAPRTHSRSDGVDCLSCHLMEDGRSVAGTRDVDTSATPGACRPKKVPAMSDATACKGCHNQHETVTELADSGIDKTCSDCHMEPVERKGAAGAVLRKGRSHVFPGGHSLQMHQRAAKLDVAVVGGEVVANVTNVGAGHKIPTDARHRSYNLWITVTDARGNPVVVDQPFPNGEMRLYYRDQFKPSTQVTYGATHTAKWPIPEGVRGKAVVRLTYALNPEELGAGKVTEVFRTEVELK